MRAFSMASRATAMATATAAAGILCVLGWARAVNGGTVCRIDRTILNENTLPMMDDIALSFFASACGKNRGAWVLDPPDGNTYSCLSFPPNFADLAGVDLKKNVAKTIVDANAINKLYTAGNLTAANAVDLLDFLVQSVFRSTPDTDTEPYACDFNGLAELVDQDGTESTPAPFLKERDDDNKDDAPPIRAVALAGLFAPSSWATGGKQLSLEEAKDFYTATDFEEMATLGINTVLITIPTAAFTSSRGDDCGSSLYHALKDMLSLVKDAGLKAILVVQSTAEELDAVLAATAFAANHSAVLGVTIPPTSQDALTSVVLAIRVKAPTLPLFVPVNGGDLLTMRAIDPLVYGALEMSHTSTIADIASSTSKEDRSKMFYHESTACVSRAPIEFSAVIRGMPVLMASGFDLAIDDCVLHNTTNFADYGQCDRFDETIDSEWWRRHRQSFAARQVYAFEQGLGWSFATWKLYPDDDDDDTIGVIDKPAKLLALKNVVAAGLFPNLNSDLSAAAQACLNPPQNDFILGDDTLAPTPGPPPDCGNGWWNYDTSKCDYWIPPTPAPTPACPVCPELNETTTAASGQSQAASSKGTFSTRSFVAGLLIGAIVTFFLMQCLGKKDRRREGFEPLPS